MNLKSRKPLIRAFARFFSHPVRHTNVYFPAALSIFVPSWNTACPSSSPSSMSFITLCLMMSAIASWLLRMNLSIVEWSGILPMPTILMHTQSRLISFSISLDEKQPFMYEYIRSTIIFDGCMANGRPRLLCMRNMFHQAVLRGSDTVVRLRDSGYYYSWPYGLSKSSCLFLCGI